MENRSECTVHNKPIQIICKDCKDLLCIECLPEHGKKSCTFPTAISTYAKEELLPKYAVQVEELKGGDSRLKELLSDFVSLSASTKESLFHLQSRLQRLLEEVSKSIKLLDANRNFQESQFSSLETSIAIQYEELKQAIESDNTNYIISALGRPIQATGIDDISKLLVKGLNKTIEEFERSTELKALTELVHEFNVKHQPSGPLPVAPQFVYGICKKASKSTVLCEYNVQTEKLLSKVEVPQYCSVLQVGACIFVSGGYGKEGQKLVSLNALSEYMAELELLTPRKSMRYCKCFHSAQALSSKAFVTLGGVEVKAIPYCEEYSLAENKWTSLPALNVARSCAAAALLNDKFLYAIGGVSTKNEIEMLDITTKKAWVMITLKENELTFNCDPAALSISSSEIVILSGKNTSATGVFNTKGSTVKRCELAVTPDSYGCNSITTIGDKSYVLGYNGHMHIYDHEKKRFKDVYYEVASL